LFGCEGSGHKLIIVEKQTGRKSNGGTYLAQLRM